MKEFKSIGYNYWPIIIWVVGFCSIIGNNKRHTTSILINIWETLHSLWEGDYGFVLDNIYYVVGSLLFVIVVSVNVLIVDRTGIIKKLFLIPIVLKRKTWREIKYYVYIMGNMAKIQQKLFGLLVTTTRFVCDLRKVLEKTLMRF